MVATMEAVVAEAEEVDVLDFDVSYFRVLDEETAQKNYTETPPYPNIDQSEYDRYVEGDLDMVYFPFFVDEIAQIRQTYDPEGLSDLANSMEKPSTPPYVWQVNPIQVNEFDNEADLRAYLDGYRVFNEMTDDIDISTFHMRPDGTWRILIAGHRRNRALRIIADRHEYMLRDADVRIDVYNNMPFSQATALQARENEHRRINPEDAAEDIYRHYRYFMKKNGGKKPTYKMLSHITGYSPGVVSQGLKYHELPDELKLIYKQGVIPYADIIRFGTLITEVKKYFLEKNPDAYGHNLLLSDNTNKLDDDALQFALAFANHIINESLDGLSGKKRTAVIEAQIQTLIASTKHVQETFEILEGEYEPSERRKKSGVALGVKALKIVSGRLSWNASEISEAELKLLREVAEMYNGLSEQIAVEQARLAADQAYLEAQAIF